MKNGGINPKYDGDIGRFVVKSKFEKLKIKE